MWTNYVPAEFLERFQQEFASTPKVLALLSQEDGWRNLAEVIDESGPDVSFFRNEIPPLLKAVDELGAEVVIDRLRTFLRRNKLAEEWEVTICDIVERAIESE